MLGIDSLLVAEGLRVMELCNRKYYRRKRYSPAICDCRAPVLAVFVLRHADNGESHKISVSYCPVCESVPVDENQESTA